MGRRGAEGHGSHQGPGITGRQWAPRLGMGTSRTPPPPRVQERGLRPNFLRLCPAVPRGQRTGGGVAHPPASAGAKALVWNADGRAHTRPAGHPMGEEQAGPSTEATFLCRRRMRAWETLSAGGGSTVRQCNGALSNGALGLLRPHSPPLSTPQLSGGPTPDVGRVSSLGNGE